MTRNILVIGRAKTGTTIISKTIQNSIEDSNYYLEPKEICFFENQGIAQGNNPNIIKIIFEHWNDRPRMRNAIIYNETKAKFDKIICIKRDPRDEIISRLFYVILPYCKEFGKDEARIKNWINFVSQKERDPQSISFLNMASKFNQLFNNIFDYQKSISSFQIYYRFLNDHKDRFFILKYEDFMKNEIKYFEEYLGFKLLPERGVGDGDLNRTNRSTSFNNWKRFFTPEDIDYFKNKIGQSLEEFGYTDWDLESTNSLNPEHGSKYVSRLIFGNNNQ